MAIRAEEFSKVSVASTLYARRVIERVPLGLPDGTEVQLEHCLSVIRQQLALAFFEGFAYGRERKSEWVGRFESEGYGRGSLSVERAL